MYLLKANATLPIENDNFVIQVETFYEGAGNLSESF
jgi:hypothetical protein